MTTNPNSLEDELTDFVITLTQDISAFYADKAYDNISVEDLKRFIANRTIEAITTLNALLTQSCQEAVIEKLSWLFQRSFHDDFDKYNPDDWRDTINKEIARLMALGDKGNE